MLDLLKRRKHLCRNDEEDQSEENPGGRVRVNFSDDRWIIDVNIDNIITGIEKEKTWAESLQARWQKAGNGDGTRQGGQQEKASGRPRSHRPMRNPLRAIPLTRSGAIESISRYSSGCTWSSSGKSSSATPSPSDSTPGNRRDAQALQDYDYMEKRSLLPGDPFYVSGERYRDRKLLEHVIGSRDDDYVIKNTSRAVGRWETEATEPGSYHDTRRDNYRRSWTRGLHQRLGVAGLGGIFLIAPMWLMVLHKTLYTALVSTTAFVAAFGFVAAMFLTSLMEVMSSTAAYAAVLVVFVGLTTENTSS